MNRRVLLVDDERRTVLLMERTLRDLQDDHEDVEILTASNGEEALELIMAEKPTLVFLDLMIPKMNGFDVCKAVKGETGMQGTHIVMLTAMGQEVDKKKAAEVGADLYLTKPFDPDKILDIAKDVLGL